MGLSLLIDEVSRSHTTTHHSRWDSVRVTSSLHRLPDNTQLSQEKDNYVSGGIQTHNLSRRAAALDRAATGTVNNSVLLMNNIG